MKYKIFAFFIVIACFACKTDDEQTGDNPNLTIPLININLNLNLPEFNPLKFPGNSIIITQQGIRGVVIYNINNDLYTAFDLSDPNHFPNECSKMSIDGIIATCPCTNDSNSYNIVTGVHAGNESLFPMQQYRTERIGDNVRIFN